SSRRRHTRSKRDWSSDVCSSDLSDGIHWLNDQGITGYPDKTFKTHNQLTREQSAIMFTEAMNLPKQPAKDVVTYFDDVPADKRAANYIATVGKAGIFKGEKGMFRPYEEMSRQQMATTIVHALGLEEKSTHKNINLDNVSETHQKNVQILADHVISYQLKDFRSYEIVSIGQYATFIYKAYQTK